MRQLVTGIHHFRAADFLSSHRLFESGGTAHREGTLMVVCSELEANPYQMISTNFANLYVIQILGNIVVPSEGAYSSDPGPIEQAIEQYRPSNLVICGHAPCSILELLWNPDVVNMPSVAAVLRYAIRARTIVEQYYPDIEDGEVRNDVLAKENVLVQLENLRSVPGVARRLDSGALHLHGWIYRYGVIHAYDVHREQFVALAQ